MIKNIVYDVGNVLVEFRYKEYMRDFGFSEELVDFFGENMVMTDFWRDMDKGLKDENDAREYFTAAFPEYRDEVNRFWDNIINIIQEYDYSNQLIHRSKAARYGVYLLSNYPDSLSDLHWATFSFMDDIDGKIISAKEKVIKPEPAIYRLLESRFGLRLNECIFIDDSQPNVDAAIDLGMQAVHFTGYDNLMDEFAKRGINVSVKF